MPGKIILTDAAYGVASEFRNTVRALSFDFAVGVQSTLPVVRLDAQDRINKERETAAELVTRLSSCLASCASKSPRTTVSSCHRCEHEPLWLIAEWPESEKATKFLLTTLARTMHDD